MNDLEINKIHLGDSYELIKKIPNNSVDLVYTDIPYLHTARTLKGGGKTFQTARELSSRIERLQHSEDFQKITKGIDFIILDEFVRVMKKTNCFIWCSRLQVHEIVAYFLEKGCNFEILFWGKTNAVPATNNVWLPDTEICLYFREKGVRLNDGFELKSKWYISTTNQHDKAIYKHPTIKPLDFVKRHLLHTTQERAIVFDPFSGSGTTCVAAKESNRQFIGIEIEPRWHKVSVDRLNGIDTRGQTSIFTDFDAN